MTKKSHRKQTILIKRAYEEPGPDDGYRVLVDRAWPRGRSREVLKLDEYVPELAPSTELRKWFNHDPLRWADFQQRYQLELSADSMQVRASQLLTNAGEQQMTLVYGARDMEHNNAIVLREFLLQLHD